MKITVTHFEVLFKHLPGRCEKTDEKSQEQRVEVGTSEYEAGMLIHSDSTFSINNCIRQAVIYWFSEAFKMFHCRWIPQTKLMVW